MEFIMNKNEILEKSRRENRFGDDYEISASEKGKLLGLKIALLFAIVILIFESPAQQFAVTALIFMPTGIELLYRAFRIKKNRWPNLIIGVSFVFYAAVTAVTHILSILSVEVPIWITSLY